MAVIRDLLQKFLTTDLGLMITLLSVRLMVYVAFLVSQYAALPSCVWTVFSMVWKVSAQDCFLLLVSYSCATTILSFPVTCCRQPPNAEVQLHESRHTMAIF